MSVEAGGSACDDRAATLLGAPTSVYDVRGLISV
jgi:hypothetical protein